MPERSRQRRRAVRLYSTLVLLVGLLSGLAGTPPGAGAAPRGSGDLYLALGDSLGVGLLASAPDTRGYVARFHSLLEQSAGHPIILRNLSVSGETTRTLIDGGQLAAAQATLAEAQRSGWRVSPITIDIGGNDLRALQARDNAAREAGLVDFRAALAQIFDTLIAATTVNGIRQGDMIAMTVYNPSPGDPKIVRSDAWWIARFNTAITEEATKRNIAVADAYGRFVGREKALTWMPLDFHANNAGHQVIANEFWRAAGYDTTPPTLEIVAPAAGAVPRAVPTIKVRAADTIGVTQVTFRLDEQPLPAPVYSRELNLWIGYWDARMASAGPHRLVVTASDAAGNTASSEVVLTR
ncbi:MAG TPA: GDSL-type esterase/lipase family protein [Thermomicrobiales bacterium]|jgi:lysophospholipase L1-like esterase